MNFDRLIGEWKELKDRIREQWNDLTEEDLGGLESERLVDALQARYGLSPGEAKEELDRFAHRFETSFKSAASSIGDAATEAWQRGKSQVRDVFAAGRDRATELWQDSRRRAHDVYESFEGAVRSRPLTSVAVAAGLGVLIALLVRPRR